MVWYWVVGYTLQLLTFMVLGFDASTSCVGWAFYNDSAIVDAGFIDLSKIESSKEKVFAVISVLDANPHRIVTTQINLEAALSGFKGGRTSQQTIIKLARFNAVFEYVVSEHWRVPVNLVSVTTARKSVFGKARVKGMTGKEYVRQQIDTRFPQLHKFDKMNTRGNPDAKNEDMYDAMIIAMSH